MSLTDIRIRKAQSQAKPYKIFDRDGLYILINPNGSKMWRYKYRFAGKEKLISFDRYPDTSLIQAREKLFEAKQLLLKGIDPSNKKREDKQQAIYKSKNTFGDIAKEWHEMNKAKWNVEHGQKILKRMERHLFPKIGRRPINDIKPLDILFILRQLEEQDKVEIAHRVLNYTSAVFKYAVITGRIEYNPASSLSGALKHKPTRHYPTIEAGELNEFLTKLETAKTSIQNKLAVKLLLLTFVRTGELRRSKWKHVDFNAAELRLPAELMKMKHPHIVPLSNQSIRVLKQLREITGDSEYILPSQQKKRNSYMSENTINYVIGLIGYKGKLVGHGFRSLASTVLNEKGFNRDAIERQLAHKEPNKVRAAYNFAQYLPERIEIMEWWGSFIELSDKNE